MQCRRSIPVNECVGNFSVEKAIVVPVVEHTCQAEVESIFYVTIKSDFTFPT